MKINELIGEFHDKWDNFPGPARLIRKDRMILAANNCAENAGFFVDTLCSKIGTAEAHQGCLANKAITTKIGQGDIVQNKVARYWLPVDGFDDIFIHLSVRIQDIMENN